MKDKPEIALVVQPQEYFRELVTTAMRKQRIQARPETEFYVVNLLNQFITTDTLYQRDERGQAKDEPLALMIKDALENPSPRHQANLFRKVGDISLYIAGFFQDSLRRKLVDVDYYIEMGGTAYQAAAKRIDDARRGVLGELAEQFAGWVDVLAEVGDRTTPKTEKDLLRLYDLWVRTRSERAAKALQEAGIVPNDTIKKDVQ